jgi:hypothetical protein
MHQVLAHGTQPPSGHSATILTAVATVPVPGRHGGGHTPKKNIPRNIWDRLALSHIVWRVFEITFIKDAIKHKLLFMD